MAGFGCSPRLSARSVMFPRPRAKHKIMGGILQQEGMDVQIQAWRVGERGGDAASRWMSREKRHGYGEFQGGNRRLLSRPSRVDLDMANEISSASGCVEGRSDWGLRCVDGRGPFNAQAEEKKRFLIGSKQVNDYDVSYKCRTAWTVDASQPGY